MKNDDRKPTTTDAGIPVASDEYSLTDPRTAGSRSDDSRHISNLHSRSRRGRAIARCSSHRGELAWMGATFSRGNERSA